MSSPSTRTLPRRVALPLQRPPAASNTTSLPPHLLHTPASLPGYLTSRHLIPSAYPRLARSAVAPPAPRPARDLWPRVGLGEGKEAKRKRVEEESEVMVQLVLQGESEEGRMGVGERFAPGLHLLVDRFVKEDWKGMEGKEALTIVCGNANGMPVEHWLLPLTKLISLQTPSQPYFIAEIWFYRTPLTPSIDPQLIGTHFSWSDHARDITSFLHHHLPLTSSPDPLPELLKWQERKQGPKRRKGVLGAGHSFSATAWLLAEMEGKMGGLEGGVWDGLVLVDPMIIDPKSLRYKYGMIKPGQANPFAKGALSRQDTWPDLASATAYLSKSPIFADFTAEQMQVLLDYGLEVVPASERREGETEHTVTLSVPRWAEALTFSGSHAFGEVWDRIESHETVGAQCRQVRWVWAGKGIATGSEADHGKLTRWLGETGVRSVASRVEGAGHMVAQEKPGRVGEVIRDVLEGIYGKEGGEKARL